jgi:sporulation protein YlmC with PRC-barrel domain
MSALRSIVLVAGLAVATLPVAAEHTDYTQNLKSANALIGKSVENSQGENLGEVEEIVLDTDQQRIAYMVLSFGGALGIGEKLFAVPFSAFTADPKEHDLTLAVSKDKLKDAPGFDPESWPNLADPAFHQTVTEFYEAPGYRLRSDQSPEDAKRDWKLWTMRDEDNLWARRLTELIGMEIEDTQGKDLAELEDVVIDAKEGRAAYAMLSYGGLAGMFEDTAAIPWSALMMDKTEQVMRLDATMADLEYAMIEDFDRLQDHRFAERIHARFNQDPYWVAYGYAPKSEKMMVKPGEVRTIEGTVQSVGTYYDGDESGLRLRIALDNGKSCAVRLAPHAYLREHRVNLNPGDKIAITGSVMERDGQFYVVAERITKDGETIHLRKDGEAQWKVLKKQSTLN